MCKNQLMLAVWVATGDNSASNKQLQVDALASTSRGEGHNQGQQYQKQSEEETEEDVTDVVKKQMEGQNQQEKDPVIEVQ